MREHRAATVVVQLAVPRGSAGSWDTGAVGKAQRKLMRELRGTGVRVVDRFRRKQPALKLLVEEDALAKLRQSPLVLNITLNTVDEPTE